MTRRRFLIQTSQALAASSLPLLSMPSWAVEAPISDKHVTLGLSLPLSGILAGAGKAHTEGAKAAIAEVNSKGGINGREIRLVFADDAYTPAKTVENVSGWLTRNEVFGIVTLVGTGNTAAVLKMIEEKGVPTVGPITGAPSLRTEKVRNVFFVRPSYADEAQRMVQQMVGMGLKRIGVVYLDNPFGEEVKALMTRELDAAKVSRAGEYKLALDGSNGDAVAQELLNAKAGAVMLATTGSANTSFMLPFREKAPAIPIAGLSVSVIPTEYGKLGDAMRGYAAARTFPDARSMKSAIARRFQASMKAAGAPEPFQTNSSSMESWLNMQVMMEGIRKAGGTPTRESLRNSLAGIRKLSFGDFDVNFPDQAPYVGSDSVDLAIFGPGGRPVN